MSLKYALRRERHAIGEFTAALNFYSSVSGGTYSAVVSKLKEIAGDLDLPAQMPIQIFNFTVGQPPPGIPALPPAGVGFQRFSKEGEVAESLMCDGNSISYALRDYTVWEEARPKLVEAFALLGEQYITEVPAIQSIRVQYLNEFRAISQTTRSAAELFRTDGKWVSPIACQSDESWHCHTGLYMPVDANQRRLVNVNCDVAPAKFPDADHEQIYAKILVLAGCYYNMPGGQPLVVGAAELREALLENLNAAHTLEKETLREIVADKYLEAMGALDAD